MNKCQVILISAARAGARRDLMTAQFAHLGLEAHILDAVTPDALSKNQIERYRFSWARGMRDGEIGCAMSHKTAWEMVVASDKPTLILEDDAIFAPNIVEVLEAVVARDDMDVVSLEYYGKKKRLGAGLPLGTTGSTVSRMFKDRGGAAAYVVWPRAAAALVAGSSRSLALADAAINLAIGLKVFQVEPACVVQAEVLSRSNPDMLELPFLGQIAPDLVAIEWPSAWVRMRCKIRRMRIALLIGVKVLIGMGRSSDRHISVDVTPQILRDLGILR